MPPDLLLAVLSRLPPNEVALSARRTCRAAAQHFAEEHHRTATIGQPLPPHATSGPLGEEAEAAMRKLSFRHKLRTLTVAAASGSVANLDVAWRLLQPSVFPELLGTSFYPDQLQGGKSDVGSAGTAAVRGGNVGALAWLLEHCPGLVNHSCTLEAAARHWSLPQLQEAWGMISSAADSSHRVDMLRAMLDAAAESPMPDSAVAKMQWVLQQGSIRLGVRTASSAARSGDLARLQWLRECGCPFGDERVLVAALRHADLSVAEWLVDEAEHPLPGPQDANAMFYAAAASGSLAKLGWLQARGVSPTSSAGHKVLLMVAAASGNTEVWWHVLGLQGCAQLSTGYAFDCAVISGSVTVAKCLRSAGFTMSNRTTRYGPEWCLAGCKGGLDMLRWLLEEASTPARTLALSAVIAKWPKTTPTDSRQLLEAARLLLPPGGSSALATQATPSAARRGDLGLLRYLHEELGGELGPHVLAEAECGGCEAMLEWLVERGCAAGAGQRLLDDCYLEAGQRGDLGTLECLRRLGVAWSEGILLKAVSGGVPVPVFQWLRGQGARMREQDVREAARVMKAQQDEAKKWRMAALLQVMAEERS